MYYLYECCHYDCLIAKAGVLNSIIFNWKSAPFWLFDIWISKSILIKFRLVDNAKKQNDTLEKVKIMATISWHILAQCICYLQIPVHSSYRWSPEIDPFPSQDFLSYLEGRYCLQGFVCGTFLIMNTIKIIKGVLRGASVLLALRVQR